MATIDWDKVENDYGPKFKAYFEDGDYKAKCSDVEFKEVGSNGSIIAKFSFEEEEKGQYPTADHWVTFKEGKDGWRQHHMKSLMVVLGASEDNARKAVEVCESKSSKDNIVKAYEGTFKKLLSKKPTVDIEVYSTVNPNDGKSYARAEFKDPTVAMPHDGGVKSDTTTANSTIDDAIAGAEELSPVDLGDIPF